jgi:hypothetical protein
MHPQPTTADDPYASAGRDDAQYSRKFLPSPVGVAGGTGGVDKDGATRVEWEWTWPVSGKDQCVQ